MCFEMEAQSSGGDIGPECSQSDDSYSLDVFGDVDELIADLHHHPNFVLPFQNTFWISALLAIDER